MHFQAWLWDAIVSFSTEVEAFIGRPWFIVDFVYITSRYGMEVDPLPCDPLN